MLDCPSWSVFFQLVKVKNKSQLLRFFDPSELETVQTVPLSSKNPSVASLSLEKRLEKIHYSWLLPFFESFVEKDKVLLISSLNNPQKKSLKRHFNLKNSLFFPKQEAKHYMIDVMYNWVISIGTGFLPIEFLPDHPLTPLVDLNKKQLEMLVDYLGLYDLGTELKQIVQSEQIKKIQNVLSKDQKSYLKQSIYGKQQITFPRLNLDRWKGDEETLKRVLHHRGFNRLAKALFGAHPSLLWHIYRQFDTGRAKVLRRFLTDIKNEEVRLILIDQILHLIGHIQSMKTK